MLIISISGSTGAGKDTAADYIANKLHLPHISGGDIIRDMLHTLNLTSSRHAVRDFSIFLRKHYASNFIIERVIDRNVNPNGVVTSGLRAPTEAETVLRKNGIIIYIEANRDIRYKRVQNRNRANDITVIGQLERLDADERGNKKMKTKTLS